MNEDMILCQNIEEVLPVNFNRRRLSIHLVNQETALKWVVDKKLLPAKKECRNCSKDMSLKFGSKVGPLGAFVCKNRSCCLRDKQIARSKDTWFSHTHLSVSEVMSLTYSFARLESYQIAKFEAASDAYFDGMNTLLLSNHTIADWYTFCRKIVIDSFDQKLTNLGLIGGPGIVVQIDESKFGKRKYHKGRRVLGHWVLGMIANESEDLRIEICPISDDCPEGGRSTEDLVPLIKKHVAFGSIIHTDSWRAYRSLVNNGYTHKIVNHSDPENPFIAPDGTHTQRIESTWRPLKDYFR